MDAAFLKRGTCYFSRIHDTSFKPCRYILQSMRWKPTPASVFLTFLLQWNLQDQHCKRFDEEVLLLTV